MKKRMLALLLTVATLVSLVVVPTYAAGEADPNVSAVTDICGCGCGKKFSEINWEKWSGEAATGHYYLAGDHTLTQVVNVISGDRMVLDLRGHTITTASRMRTFEINGYVGVLDTVGGGRVSGQTVNDVGGLIYVFDNETDDATFELFSGTVTPSGTKNATTGGLIYVSGGGSFIMHGGVLLNGKSSTSGGCLGVAGINSEARILGGQIIGGKATKNGGNVNIVNKATLTMENCTVIGGTAGDKGGNIMISDSGTVATIKSCTIANGVSEHNPASGTVYGGGNICAYASANMTLENCQVYGGYAVRSGGNICLGNGTQTLKNNTITGGTCGSFGANLACITPSANTTIEGGTITGDVYWGNGALTLKGAVKIGLGATGLRTNKTRNAFNASGLTAGAEIYLDTTYGGMTGVKSDYFKPAYRAVLTGTDGSLQGGNAADGETAGYCPHCMQPVAWQPYGTANAVHTYLTGDMADFAELTVTGDQVVDLAGFDITATGRAFHVAAGGSLTVVDSIGGGIVTGSGVNGEAGGVITNAGTLTLYGGKYVYAAAADVTVAGGGVIYNSGALSVNGSILDGSAYANTDYKGGAVGTAEGEAVTFTARGIRVFGGSALMGGGMNFAANNQVSIQYGVITGGESTNGGGNLSCSGAAASASSSENLKGMLNLTGVAITGGKTTVEYGGNLHITRWGANVTDCYLDGGTTEAHGGNLNLGICPATGVKIQNTVITDGTSESVGGNINCAGRSKSIILENCLILNGKGTDGGNINVNNGVVTIKGGEIAHGNATGNGGNISANAGTAGSDQVTFIKNDNGEAPRILRGTAAGHGGNLYATDTVTVTDAFFNGGSAVTEVNDIYIPSNATSVTLGSGVTGQIYMDVYESLKVTDEIGTKLDKITASQMDAQLYVGNVGTLLNGETLYAAATAVIDENGNDTWYYNNAAAVDACDEDSYVKLFTSNDLVLTKDLYVDLNGNTVNVAENGYAFYGMDSTGDGYSEPAGSAAGVTAQTYDVIDALNGNRYIAMANDGTVTYHRLGMQITGVTIRPSDDGMYYTAKWSCDDTLKALISNYGIVTSLADMPDENFVVDETNLWTALGKDTFQSGVAKNSALIRGILRTLGELDEEGNPITAEKNSEYGKTPVYAKAYISFENGPTLLGTEDTKFSLYQLMKALDKLIMEKPIQYRPYHLTARNFYEKWKDSGMGDWKLNKIPDPGEDDVIDLLMVGSSFCYYYVEELYGLAEAAGIKLRVCNLYDSGCPLEDHYNWWQGKQSKYQFYETYTEGRKLKGANVSLEWALAQREWDFISLQESSSACFKNEDWLNKTQGYWEPLLSYFSAEFPNAQILWHQPWTYQVTDYPKEEYEYMTSEHQQSYQEEIEAFAVGVSNYFEGKVQRVNTGRAWQILRNPEYEYSTGYDYLCCRLSKSSGKGDGYHDGDIGGGQYLNACVWFEVITGKSCVGNSYIPTYSGTPVAEVQEKLAGQVTFADGKCTLKEDFVLALQRAAHDAVTNATYGLGLTIN